MNGLQLRPLVAADHPWLARVARAAYAPLAAVVRGGWDDAAQAERLRARLAALRWEVIEAGGAAVGALATRAEADHLRLGELLVDVEHQGRGVGTAALGLVCARATAAGLPVRLRTDHRNRAVALYERAGFRAQGREGPYLWMERPPG